MGRLIKAIYDSNLCTYYLLPLIRLNRFSFGDGNFVQCYVNKEGNKLFIRLRTIPDFLLVREDYLGAVLVEGTGEMIAIVYLPANWYADFIAFQEGKYSKLSGNAKDHILAYSGLPFNQYDRDQVSYTDSRILALDPDQKSRDRLRRALSDELGVEIPRDMELISIPSEDNYIDDTSIIKPLELGSGAI